MINKILTEKILTEISSFDENENHSLVGYFPELKLTRGTGKNKIVVHTYPQADIYIKYGYQENRTENGYGIRHILEKHINDSLYASIQNINDIVEIVKNAIRKNNRIYVRTDNLEEMKTMEKTFVISSVNKYNQPILTVLKWLDNEKIYSVTTCYNINNRKLQQYSNQDSIGKIKKSLETT